MPVGMLRWYCPVYTSQLHFAVCAARLSALSTDHSRCANSCLFCNSSVFLLSSALSPSDPCFSARQSCLEEMFEQTNHFLRSGPAGQEYWRSDAAQGFKIFVRCGEKYCAVR